MQVAWGQASAGSAAAELCFSTWCLYLNGTCGHAKIFHFLLLCVFPVSDRYKQKHNSKILDLGYLDSLAFFLFSFSCSSGPSEWFGVV